jgi:hypothetical protein
MWSLYEERHHADFICVRIHERPPWLSRLKADPVICRDDDDRLVQQSYLLETSEQITDHPIYHLDLQQMALIALVGKNRLHPKLIVAPGQLTGVVVLDAGRVIAERCMRKEKVDEMERGFGRADPFQEVIEPIDLV